MKARYQAARKGRHHRDDGHGGDPVEGCEDVSNACRAHSAEREAEAKQSVNGKRSRQKQAEVIMGWHVDRRNSPRGVRAQHASLPKNNKNHQEHGIGDTMLRELRLGLWRKRSSILGHQLATNRKVRRHVNASQGKAYSYSSTTDNGTDHSTASIPPRKVRRYKACPPASQSASHLGGGRQSNKKKKTLSPQKGFDVTRLPAADSLSVCISCGGRTTK